jgi:hypothetical protein
LVGTNTGRERYARASAANTMPNITTAATRKTTSRVISVVVNTER